MDDIDWSKSEVEHIHSTPEAEKLMKSKELCMVVIYAKWCSHCKDAAPKLKELSKKVKGKAKVYVIESEEYTGDKAKGYPTIKIVKGGVSTDYDGSREVADMEKALLGASGGKRTRRGGTRRFRNRRRKTHRSTR